VIAGSTLVMVLFSIAPFFITTENGEEMVGGIYLWTAIASGALMIALSIWVIFKPKEQASWTLFKFSSPYLSVLFIALMIDTAL
jgi:protoheme IX farnesyltransferase